MKLTIDQLKDSKKNDTIFILGCGPSVGMITKSQKEYINSSCDSVAFNWFCLGKSGINPDFYFIDAQGLRKSERKSYNLRMECFLEKYKTGISIIVEKSSRGRGGYEDVIDRITTPVLVVKRLVNSYMSTNEKAFLLDLETGIYNGLSALYYAVHFAVWMKYKQVVFLGVDLYDQSYYFDGGKEWYFLTAEGMKREDRHQHADHILKTVKAVKELTPDIEWLASHKRSLLSEHLETLW